MNNLIDGIKVASEINDEITTILPITIQVNPPDLYMVGLNNSNFTIDEDAYKTFSF